MANEYENYGWIDAMLRAGSEADRRYRDWARAKSEKRTKVRASASVGKNDLIRHGGRVVHQSIFRNVFLGGTKKWTDSDVDQVDNAIAAAVADRRLENVLRQYLPGQPISCERGERLLPAWAEKQVVTKADVQEALQAIFDKDPGLNHDLDSTIFNFILPRGVILSSGGATSLEGLGGFHGSLPIRIANKPKLVYYSVNVFSERSQDGTENGIHVFSPPWKNIVATLYHEINEFRTDPDVAQANTATSEEESFALLGWVSDAGEEIGDHPLNGEQSLSAVFREILLANESGRVPVQFMYSNAIHAAQGPVELASDATRRKGHGVGLRGLDEVALGHAKEGRFGRMFELPARGDVAPFPEDLGLPSGPMDGGLQHRDSTTLFAVMTYFGQFLDHDITFDPTSSLERQQDPSAVHNFRTPALELDNVYGGGPTASPYLYDQSKANKMLLGRATNDTAEVDLPRNSQGVAVIGDPRNDENLIVSQLHVAFLKFHNAIVDQLSSIDDGIADATEFAKAQRLVRWHYQWLVLHKFLPAIVGQATVDDILTRGRKLYDPRSPFIPVEFSVAAYRFGHSIVQPGYGINDGFGAILFPSNSDAPPASPGQPRADLRGGPIRFEERVNWKNFVDTGVPPSPGATRFASKLDTKLAAPLLNLPLSVVPAGVPAALRSLAVRNLQRSVALKVPSGQHVAARVVPALPPQIPVLSDAQLWGDPLTSQFKGKEAPLWYYILREAEVLGLGEHLGPIGGRIVGEVIIGLLQLDPSSFLHAKEFPHAKELAHAKDWKPQAIGRQDPNDFTFADFFRIAGTDVD